MSTRLTPPRTQYADSAGLPYPGGKLSFFESGTTTPLDTFSDEALTTANANPVVADSAGIFGEIFLQAQDYKVVLKDADDNEVFTADPVKGSTTQTVAVTDIADGTDGELITWDSSGQATTVAVGTSGQVLTSNGVGAAPTMQDIPAQPNGDATTAGLFELATAAEVAAETATGSTGASLAVSPDLITNHQGVAKVWVNFNGTGTVAINDSHNVSSISDNGTGNYGVNFSNNFSNASYSVQAISNQDGINNGNRLITTGLGSLAVSSVAVIVRGDSTNVDASVVTVNCFGDV